MRRVASAFLLALLVAPPLLAQRDLTPLDVVTMKAVAGVFPGPDGSRTAVTPPPPPPPPAAGGARPPAARRRHHEGRGRRVPRSGREPHRVHPLRAAPPGG